MASSVFDDRGSTGTGADVVRVVRGDTALSDATGPLSDRPFSSRDRNRGYGAPA